MKYAPLFLLIILFSCTKEIPESNRKISKSAQENSVRAVVENYFLAFNNQDVESALFFIDPDYRGVVYDSSDIVGADALFADLSKNKNLFDGGKWSNEIEEIIVSGGIAYVRAASSFLKYDPIEKKDNPVYSEKSFRILRKQKDDSWKIFRYIAVNSFTFEMEN
jgi:ketosteroid isomerase-like protein